MINVLERAHKHLCEICNDHNKFRMSIPVHKNDSDEILSAAIDYGDKASKVFKKLGPWASAAQEDPKCCQELKDIFQEVMELDQYDL